MKYRIETREAFDVFGIYREISTDRDKAFEEVPRFADNATPMGASTG